ncbi:MAG: hypothetical protein KAU20_05785 [Nanoarchaeota archaeon]|nr:hypothetical protein [Nanoarchaeota archaeon]
MKKKNIHIKISENSYFKAKEVFPLYGEITFAISKLLEWIIENPEKARNFVYRRKENDEI